MRTSDLQSQGALPFPGEDVPAVGDAPRLAWLDDAQPVSVEALPGLPIGLVAGQGPRWALLERRPSHRSPGRWYFLCPRCGRRCLRLERQGAGWACTRCLGLPASVSWPLSRRQRERRALDKATQVVRAPFERHDCWQRRLARAAKAIARAQAAKPDGLAKLAV